MENVYHLDRLDFQYYNVPDHTKGALERYILRGIPPGGFLEAVLSNDLKGAFARADIENRNAMYEIVTWIHNYAPSGCWGSKDRVNEWLKSFHSKPSASDNKRYIEDVMQGIQFINGDRV